MWRVMVIVSVPSLLLLPDGYLRADGTRKNERLYNRRHIERFNITNFVGGNFRGLIFWLTALEMHFLRVFSWT